MIEGFEEFEELLSRCLSSEKNARPLNAVVLRNEPVFVEFLSRIEDGEIPSDIIMPPEDMIRRLRQENKQQTVEIKQLEERIKEKEKENKKQTVEIKQLQERIKEKEKGDKKQTVEIKQLQERIKQKDKEIQRLKVKTIYRQVPLFGSF